MMHANPKQRACCEREKIHERKQPRKRKLVAPENRVNQTDDDAKPRAAQQDQRPGASVALVENLRFRWVMMCVFSHLFRGLRLRLCCLIQLRPLVLRHVSESCVLAAL